MLPATEFIKYWSLAFVTLCTALVALDLFYRFVDSDLALHGWRKEAVIACVASLVQGAGFWFSASLFQDSPFFRPVLVVPMLALALIYWLTHLEDWSGYEIGGIGYFQAALLATGVCLLAGEVQLAVMVVGLFAAGLALIAGIARSL